MGRALSDAELRERRCTPLVRALLWALLAVVLALLGQALELRTTVELFSTGGRLELEVAGTRLTVPVTLGPIRGLALTAAEELYPLWGGAVELEAGGEPLLSERLPLRLVVPSGAIAPLGDWYLDDRRPRAVAWCREVAVEGPFTLRVGLRGRFLQEVRIWLEGRPGAVIGIRRGLINNDLFVYDGEGRVLASTSIDPCPLARGAAVLATLAHAAAAAAVLIAFVLLVARALDVLGVHRPPGALQRKAVWPAVALCAGVALVLSALTARAVLGGLPHLPDGIAYLLEAKRALAGAVAPPAPPLVEHLTIPYTYVAHGKWLTHYPIGWPLVLAAGVAAGAPWLVNPLLGALLVVALFALGRRLFSPGVALLACLLAALSPLARLLASSLLAHQASALAAVVFLALLVRARSGGGPAAAIGAGLALGLAIATRPLSGAAVGCAAVLWASVAGSEDGRARLRRRLPLFLAGLGVGLAPALVDNALVTGNPLVFPYALASAPLVSPANLVVGMRNLDALLASTPPALFGWGWQLAPRALWLALPLALPLVPFLLRRATSGDALLATVVVTLVVAHLGVRAHGLHGYGPRYYFAAFPCLFLLAARGFGELARLDWRERVGGPHAASAAWVAAVLGVALVVSSALALPVRLALYRGYNGVDGGLERQLAARERGRYLVVFAGNDWRAWAEAAPMVGADPWGEHAFAALDGGLDPLLDRFGERRLWWWQDGVLSRLERGRAAPTGAHPTVEWGR